MTTGQKLRRHHIVKIKAETVIYQSPQTGLLINLAPLLLNSL